MHKDVLALSSYLICYDNLLLAGAQKYNGKIFWAHEIIENEFRNLVSIFLTYQLI